MGLPPLSPDTVMVHLKPFEAAKWLRIFSSEATLEYSKRPVLIGVKQARQNGMVKVQTKAELNPVK